MVPKDWDNIHQKFGQSHLYPIMLGDRKEGFRLEIALSDQIDNSRRGIALLLEKIGLISTAIHRHTNILQCPLGRDRIDKFPKEEIIALWLKAAKDKLMRIIRQQEAYEDRDDSVGFEIEQRMITDIMKHIHGIYERCSKGQTATK